MAPDSSRQRWYCRSATDRQVRSLHSGTTHSVHHRTTSHGKTKDEDNPSCASTGSHLYPFHGRLNQNKSHSMKKGNAKVNSTEKKGNIHCSSQCQSETDC